MRYTYEIKMPEHESAACGMAVVDGVLCLISYSTLVARYNISTHEIQCSGLYSATTRKHIGWFAHYINNMYDQNLSYYDFKALV